MWDAYVSGKIILVPLTYLLNNLANETDLFGHKI